jgi:prolyl oligopeptidase
MKKNYEYGNIFEEDLRRALYPPHDDTQEVLHGIVVQDPFRPLENLNAPETTAWVQRQNKQFLDYIADVRESETAASAFLSDAMNYDSFGLPNRFDDKYFRYFRAALAAQIRVEISESADGPWEPLLDPNKLSQDGTVALSNWVTSKDGKRIAYLLSESGSDVQTLQILDVETLENLPDVIKDCRFTSILWDKDSHDSFQYTYPTHDGSRRLIVKHHIIGQPVEQDSKVFEGIAKLK